MRDNAPAVRLEAAKALGKLGKDAIAAAPNCRRARRCGHRGGRRRGEDARGLWRPGARRVDARSRDRERSGGRRVGELIVKLPGAAKALTEAFTSPSVNVQVNAALALGVLGARA